MFHDVRGTQSSFSRVPLLGGHKIVRSRRVHVGRHTSDDARAKTRALGISNLCVRRMAERSPVKRYLVESLREKLQAAENATSPERAIALIDEVELARLLAAQSLNRWEAAQASKDENLKHLCSSIARDALTHVGDMVTKAARVRALFVGSVDFAHLDYIIHQVLRIFDDEKLDDETKMRIAERIKNIKVVSVKHDQVQAPHVARGIRAALSCADATVPSAPPEEAHVSAGEEPSGDEPHITEEEML